ncbi:MAG TPA: glycosyltransferase [Flavisolibacter sp.]|nr:glycosyltransferase [Flavisolibacter sp.]
MPVRNGASYVKECVKSLQQQNHYDFDILILDNCSTDGTREWIESIQDHRIKIFSSDKPLTIEENWSRILDVPKNEFITLIGHDDILQSDYLTTMDELISKYPDASLYQTHFQYIDSDGKKIKDCKPMAEIETGTDFLKSFLQNRIDIMGTGFMMRSKDYDEIGGLPDYPNLLFADFELWMNLTKKTFKATSQKNCFSFRLHVSTTTSSSDIKMQKAFERFVYYLSTLKQESPEYNELLNKYGEDFIRVNCKGLSHRLIRTPFENRQGLTVATFVKKCKQYADLLIQNNQFDPISIPSIKFAAYIDSSTIGRSLFLLFKKLFPNPILK